MRTERFGTVSRMKDCTESGYGPGYVSGREGSAWLFWQADSFQPDVRFIRCASFEEAWEHAEVCIGYPLQPGDLTEAEELEVWEQGSAHGYSCGPDGVIRHTENIGVAELRCERSRND